MKQMLCLLLLLSSAWVFAEEECDETPSKIKPLLEVANAAAKSGCMDSSKLNNLCSDVATRTPDKDPNSLYEYSYQRQVYEAACVNLEKDSEEEIAKKVSTVWKANEAKLTCTTLQFNVEKGSILKFAVSRTFTSFLDDAIEIWKVNLNKVDASDGRTLLDYVKHELERNKGNPNEKVMQQYYDKLKSAGAKHKSEL